MKAIIVRIMVMVVGILLASGGGAMVANSTKAIYDSKWCERTAPAYECEGTTWLDWSLGQHRVTVYNPDAPKIAPKTFFIEEEKTERKPYDYWNTRHRLSDPLFYAVLGAFVFLLGLWLLLPRQSRHTPTTDAT